VEALEAKMMEKERINDDIQRKYRDLEMQLADAQAKNLELQQQLELATGGSMTVFRGSVASSPAHTDQFRAAPTPVTFSQELFGSRDSPERSSFTTSHTIDSQSPPQTVNPASLSPEIRPVAEFSNASSSDMTQHPAAMLWNPDLQCQSEEQRPWTTLALSQILALTTLITTITAVSSTLLASLIQITKSLQTKSSLLPTASILTTIIWLTTTPASLTILPSRNSSTTTITTNPYLKLSLRIRLLNHLLACNPHLARPLMDATMEEMRLVSEQQLTRDCLSGIGSSDRLDGDNSPSIESLMTLLWTTRCFEKKWKEASRLDATMNESRQEHGELDGMDGLFRQHTTFKTDALDLEASKKSLEGWRLA
jgi:transcriptional activator HAC1